MVGPQPCKVCESASSKYKCPSCFLPYCSIPCYKQHKETPCTRSESSTTAQIDEGFSLLHHVQPSRQFEIEDEHEWRLQQSQFEAIANSEEIRTLLKAPKLQELVRMIDSSSDVEKDLNTALDVELFREFRDKILAVIRPEEV